MGRPTLIQEERLARAETTLLRLNEASVALGRAITRLGQLRRKMSCDNLIDYTLGDIAEVHAILESEWNDRAEHAKEIREEITSNGNGN